MTQKTLETEVAELKAKLEDCRKRCQETEDGLAANVLVRWLPFSLPFVEADSSDLHVVTLARGTVGLCGVWLEVGCISVAAVC